MSEKKVPFITVKVVDLENWTLAVDAEIPHLDYGINMLEQALRGLKAQLQDQEAIDFQRKMMATAQGQRAVAGPKIIKPQ